MPPREKKSSRSTKTSKRKPRKKPATPKLSRLQKPEGMSLEDWQVELRRQYGREQPFELDNLDDEKFFAEFELTNPQSGSSYRLIVRGDQPFDNYCSCPDFATNTLGTCKHLEFAVAALKRKRGGKTAFREGFHPAYSEVYLHHGMQKEVRFRQGEDISVELARLTEKYFDDEGVLLPEAFASFDIFLQLALEAEPVLHVADDAVEFVAEVRDSEQRRLRVAEAFPKGIRSTDFENLIRANLYDYQKEGALFAARAGRCLIGDEMGLGKTIQSIAAVEIMARLFGVERVLIVCPTSLKHQWQSEIERFVDRPVMTIGGLRPQREKLFGEEAFFKITNYDTIHSDLELIEKWDPDLVILDEAQRIKNWQTRVARSVKRIHSPYAIVLTGTPLENRLEELISIVQFVDRHRLGPTFRLLHEHQVRDEHGKVVGYENLDKIGRSLEPVLMRRQKLEVMDQLPERIDSTIFVPMTQHQRHIHTENMEIVARIVQKWKRYRFLSEADQRRLMVAMERMRMVCDNSYLVDHQNDHGPKADEAVTLLAEILEDPKTKVVVFSQWLRMHELLVRRIEEQGWDHVLFHGGVPAKKRKTLVERFRNDPECRLFLSTDAGGVGLNLQHAAVVINMDMPWNPAVLEQRIGRIHRLGQKQSVSVINFVTKGGLEEGMLQVLKFKKSLFAGVLDGGAKDVFLGRKIDKFMEQVEATTTAVPESMVEDDEEPHTEPPSESTEPSSRATSKRKSKRTTPSDSSAPTSTATPSEADPWGSLLQMGMGLLSQFVDGAKSPTDGEPAKSMAANFVKQDEQSGETYLKLPVPSKEVLETALQAVGSLLERLQHK